MYFNIGICETLELVTQNLEYLHLGKTYWVLERKVYVQKMDIIHMDVTFIGN